MDYFRNQGINGWESCLDREFHFWRCLIEETVRCIGRRTKLRRVDRLAIVILLLVLSELYTLEVLVTVKREGGSYFG